MVFCEDHQNALRQAKTTGNFIAVSDEDEKNTNGNNSFIGRD